MPPQAQHFMGLASLKSGQPAGYPIFIFLPKYVTMKQ